jgi:uncharacterized protein YfbU (UPF0304 family)
MRRVTAKRIRFYANFLKNTHEDYADVPINRIYRRLKKLWKSDPEFKSYLSAKVIKEAEDQVLEMTNS